MQVNDVDDLVSYLDLCDDLKKKPTKKSISRDSMPEKFCSPEGFFLNHETFWNCMLAFIFPSIHLCVSTISFPDALKQFHACTHTFSEYKASLIVAKLLKWRRRRKERTFFSGCWQKSWDCLEAERTDTKQQQQQLEKQNVYSGTHADEAERINVDRLWPTDKN